jgi:hypothetical protein
LTFNLPSNGQLSEPEDDFERDTYRSYSRGYIQMPQQMLDNDNNETL